MVQWMDLGTIIFIIVGCPLHIFLKVGLNLCVLVTLLYNGSSICMCERAYLV